MSVSSAVYGRQGETRTSTLSTAPHRAVSSLIQGYGKSILVCIAAKVRVADHLASGPKTIQQLAPLMGMDERLALRFLRGFATCGIVQHGKDGWFELTGLGEVLQENAPGSLYPLAVRVHDIDYHAWGALLGAVQGGKVPFESLFGMAFYDYLRETPHRNSFDQEMRSTTADDASQLVEAYDFSGASSIVDVGGGDGAFLSEILRRNPSSRGILLELGDVRERAVKELALRGLCDRCTVIAGSFLDSVPAGGQFYILKRVLHNWSDADCGTILTNCRNALSRDGTLLIIERLMSTEVLRSDPNAALDLAMFALLGGGERTVPEFESMLIAGGFRMGRVLPTGSPFSIIEALPQ